MPFKLVEPKVFKPEFCPNCGLRIDVIDDLAIIYYEEKKEIKSELRALSDKRFECRCGKTLEYIKG